MTSWTEQLEVLKAEVQGRSALQQEGESYGKYLERLKEQVQGHEAEPWREKLERLKGRVDHEGGEFVTTKELLAAVGVSQRGHQVGAHKRIAPILKSLGWEPVRRRGLTPTGLLDQVRGWARQPAPSKKKPVSCCPHCGGAVP